MIRALRLHLGLWGEGFGAAARLARVLLGGQAKGGLAGLFANAATQHDLFAALRAFRPNLRVSRRLITAYENTGTAIVTRSADVREVLEREADFAVVYEPKMRGITAGENFFLGMQDSAAYQRDTSNMRVAMRRDDVARIVAPVALEQAEAIVAAAPGRLDLAADLTRRIPARIVMRYFGLPHADEDALIAQATRMFWYLFVDLRGEEAVTEAGLDAAAEARAWIDAAIAARRAAPADTDDLLGRCLAMGHLPGMDDVGIRNNLIGLVIGLVPTLSRAAVQALAQLLARPEALAGAQAAARAGDDAALAAHVFEALRFDPVNPVIYRRATRDCEIARGTRRGLRIPAGSMVLASNLSAMFDPLALERPGEFRADRPWGDYMLWGHGMHTCFGAHINRAVVPAMLRPVLARPGLRAEAPVDTAGTPFPVHFRVAWDG